MLMYFLYMKFNLKDTSILSFYKLKALLLWSYFLYVICQRPL